jgi:alkanesulfonate monooxygenase
LSAARRPRHAKKFDRIQSLIPIEFALYMLSDLLGEVDLSPYPVDGPLPDDLPPSNGSASRRDLIIAMGTNEKLTIRQLALKVSGASGHRVVVGTPEQIADGMQEWFEAEAADGFNIQPPFMPEAFDDFCALVVPELQRRGLFRTEYSGSTLREHLGQQRPAGCFAGRDLAAAE